MFIEPPLISDNRLVNEHQVVGEQAVKMRPTIRTSAALTFLLLAGCSSGGGGGGGGSTAPVGAVTPATTTFTSFGNVISGAQTIASGITREGSVAINQTGAILQNDVSTPTEGTGSVTFTVNSTQKITDLTIAGAKSSASFNSSNSTAQSLTLNGQSVATLVYNSDGSKQALYADPFGVGFNYQSFGVWGTGLVAGGTGSYGAVSVGAKTVTSAVPTSGNANFIGYVGGIYTNGATNRYAANANFNVNFSNRTVDVSTSGSTLTPTLTNTTFGIGYLNISGTMSYFQGTSNFSGSLSAAGQNAPLSGAGSGTFYGPNANELGGTFFLRGPTTTLIGGFGAKR